MVVANSTDHGQSHGRPASRLMRLKGCGKAGFRWLEGRFTEVGSKLRLTVSVHISYKQYGE